MLRVGVWEINVEDMPKRMADDRDYLEKHLEAWIERDPSLLGGDIKWVSRQLTLPGLSRLDLLGLTPDNTWVVAELKAGPVDGEAVEQVLGYFLQIAGMTNAQLVQRVRSHRISDESVVPAVEALDPLGDDGGRTYRLLVAGVGSGESAEAVARILARHGLDVVIQVVTFRLLRDSTGRRFLIREVQEESNDAEVLSRPSIRAIAEQHGVLAGFEALVSELEGRGYRPYRKQRGLNFNRGTRLQCFWVAPREGKIHVGYLSGNFPSLFGIAEERAQAEMGPNWVDLDPADAITTLRRWMDVLDGYAGRDADMTLAP